MSRKQNGTIMQRSGKWYVSYWEKRNVAGVVERKRVTHCLGDVTTRGKRPPADIEQERDRHMAKINSGAVSAERIVTVGDFVERVYLPWAERELRASTVKGYKDAWRNHLKPLCEKLLLRDTLTFHVQRWLDVAAGKGLSRNTLHHIKTIVSGIFSYAKQQGYYVGSNPAEDARVSRHAPPPKDGYDYDLDEVRGMLAVLPEPGATAFCVAVFAGLRLSEIKALKWEDIHDGAIHVCRSIWNNRLQETKTEASRAPVPMIKQLADRLELHRLLKGNPKSGWVFPNSLTGEKQGPLDLDNVCARYMKPALNRCEICKASELGHDDSEHEYKRDASIPEWHGWHAGRRGVATILKDMGVDDLIIQQILRHSDVTVTRRSYIKRLDKSVENAMQKFGTNVEETIGRLNADSENASKHVN